MTPTFEIENHYTRRETFLAGIKQTLSENHPRRQQDSYGFKSHQDQKGHEEEGRSGPGTVRGGFPSLKCNPQFLIF
jgi:hypothetical protein